MEMVEQGWPCLCCDFCQCDSGSVASDQAGATSGHMLDCPVANIAQGEHEGTRHPEFPMLKILLVLKPKNIFYTTLGVYSDRLLSL